MKCALQVIPLGKCDGMDEYIDRRELVGRFAKKGRDLVIITDIALLDEGRADGFGQGADTSLECLRGIRERHAGPVFMQGSGDAPGDGMVICDSKDERSLSLEKFHPSISSCI